jgi:hypothetical protein
MAKAKRGQGWVEPRPYAGGVRYQARMQVAGSIMALGPIRDTAKQAERDRVLGSDKHEHGTLTRLKKGRLGPSLVQWLDAHKSTAGARTFYADPEGHRHGPARRNHSPAVRVRPVRSAGAP